jgi:hypothetical protein
MASAQFIEHKGKKILHLDFTGCKIAELPGIIQTAKAMVGKEAPGSVRTLTNVTNMEVTKETSAIMKDFTTFNKPYVVAGAVVGVTGLKKVIYSAIVAVNGRNMSTFDTIDQAKDWLATQS